MPSGDTAPMTEALGDAALAHDDILLFEDETVTVKSLSQGGSPWRVLVVDDEDDVYRATAFSLRDLEIDNRALELLQATSARQALEVIAHEPNIAVVLLDVVMESEDAGLRAVERIRAMPGREAVRIILRTGQPGYAPELDIIRRYDINDYKTKSELTQVRLVTALTVAVRGYHQLVKLQAHQRGLSKVVSASGMLVTQRHSLQSFAEGVLTQICEISDCSPQGAVVLRGHDIGGENGHVVAAAGVYHDLIGQPLALLPSDIRQLLGRDFGRAVSQMGRFEAVRIRSASGDDLVVLLTAHPPLDDVARHMLEVFAYNISLGLDNVQVFQEMEHLAHHDVETELPNRAGFRRGLQPQGMLFGQVQIDELEDIRGTLGEAVTSQLIAEVGRRLARVLGPQARVARVNGDRIALAVTAAEGGIARERVLTVLAQPVAVAGLELQLQLPMAVGWSIGGDSVTQAIDEAGLVVSRLPGGRQVRSGEWTTALGSEVRSRVRLLGDLHDALAEDRIEMFLQPQVRLPDERVIGAEALVRWRNRDGSLVMPAAFIPMAEQTGAIRELGERVTTKAVLALARWGAAAHRLSVNVSMRQLEEAGFADWLVALCQLHGVACPRLRLEITETAFTLDHSQVQASLEALSGHGFELSIDDFGTGHSSLGRLTELRFQELKIDRSLVHGLELDARARKLAAMIVELGQDLGVEVLAEGVETEAQLLRLRDMGCHLAQGWRWGKAMPQAAYEALYGLGSGVG